MDEDIQGSGGIAAHILNLSTSALDGGDW